MTRARAALALLALAFVALVPGVTLPVIDLTGEVEKREIAELGKQMVQDESSGLSMFGPLAARFIDSLNAEGTVQVYHERRSILGTVRELAGHGHWFVAFLIMLFSVLVPVAKGTLLAYSHLGVTNPAKARAFAMANAISKWSMADVFVIAVFVAYLAANATQNSDEIVRFDAHFGAGLYWFSAYCLLSIASAALLSPRPLARSTS